MLLSETPRQFVSPSRESLHSISVVPAGKTKFRDNLFPLESFSKDDAKEVIAQVESYADECLEKFGSRLFFCADEFYIKAELPLHDEDYYEGYAQIENGVGMLTSLLTEFGIETEYIDEYLEKYAGSRGVADIQTKKDGSLRSHSVLNNKTIYYRY
mgnify:CR=1 FL=1